MKDIKSMDLNLLKALDVLLDERNVTRAAARLGLTQPALSGMLARLRESGSPPDIFGLHSASAALLLVLVMLMTALASRPVLWPEGRLTLGLLALALGFAGYLRPGMVLQFASQVGLC